MTHFLEGEKDGLDDKLPYILMTFLCMYPEIRAQVAPTGMEKATLVTVLSHVPPTIIFFQLRPLKGLAWLSNSVDVLTGVRKALK